MVEDEIVAIRKELDRHGHEAGAATIAFHLAQRHGSTPAVSTIWRILSQRGFVTPQPHKRPKSSYLRFAAEQPNQRWQADITHWRLADDTGIEILNLLDDHSRYCLDSHTRRVFNAPTSTADSARRTDHSGIRPACSPTTAPCSPADPAATGGSPSRSPCTRVASASGTPGPTTRRPAARSNDSTRPSRTGCSSSHQRPPPRQLQTQLDTFRRYYNQVRPHRALGRRTPAQAYTARPKAVPTGTPLHAGHWRVRHDRIDPSGVFTLRHNSRLHHIGIGRRHAGTDILVLIHNRDIRVLTTDGQLLRELVLDPSRDYQPQPKP